MDDKLISRDLTQEDCLRLPELLEKVWKTKTTPDYWQWKFFQPPFETKCMVIEGDDGGMVAFSGFWLRPTTFGDKVITPGTLVDVMADPEYRGGKAFRLIMQRIKSEVFTKRVFFGFTNPVSHKIFGRAFKEFVTIDTRICVFHSLVRAGSYLSSQKPIKAIGDSVSRFGHKLRLGRQSNNNISVQQTDSIGDEFDQLWEDVKGEYYWIQHRGKDFLKWRYLLDPTRKYQIWKAMEADRLVGYLITTINQDTERAKGLFVDWLVPHSRNDVFKEMVKSAFNWLIDQNVDLVETWLMDHEKQWASILKSIFFLKAKHSRSLILGGAPDYADPNLHVPENFFLTIGDSDYLGTV